MAVKTLVETILWLEELFERHKVDRSYGGAIARNFYAPPRFTKDIDVLVLVGQLQLPAVVEELIGAGCRRVVGDTTGPLEIRGVLEDLCSGGRMTVILYGGVVIEAFVPWHPFHHKVLKRSLVVPFETRTIKAHAPEDLIVFKKIFDRSKDIEDIKAILASNPGKLDSERIVADAKDFLTEDSLEELKILIRDFYR